ncbi:hypothetical protein LJR034_002639 [Caballeronia sp. LjRoot34]|uniref:hypothetical protein n=1 Tax=Caballeronia sp. LjRoot34 TaxID=3342325 RepID=UPI003ECD3EB3
MRRATVLRSKIHEIEADLQKARNARTEALQAVSLNPTNDEAHAKLTAALEAPKGLQAHLEALTDALDSAERQDHEDELASMRAGWLAARDRAVALSAARTKSAKAVEAAVGALAVALTDLEKDNDAVLLAIYEATQGAAPKRGGAHDEMVFGQRVGVITGAVTSPLRGAFVVALNDAGIGKTGLNLHGMLEYVGSLALAKRETLAAAVKASTNTITYALDELHKWVGITAPDPIVEFAPPIPPPMEVEAPDGSIHTYDVSETTWAAQQ